MSLFDEEEVIQIRNVFKDVIKEEGKIKESYYIIRQLDNTTDFERYKYDSIEKIIDYHLKYDGYIDNSNLKEVILDIEEQEDKNTGVFTKTNIIVSIISAIILLFTSIETNNVFFLIALVYGLIWAYLSKFIGIKKGIYSGYVWGYFLGIIGFIVVCVLPGEDKEEGKQQSNSNKYEDIAKLQKLREQGAITEAEFEVEKAKLLK